MELTARDLELHATAVERIRAQLFSRYSPADLRIVEGSEQVIPPSRSTWNVHVQFEDLATLPYEAIQTFLAETTRKQA